MVRRLIDLVETWCDRVSIAQAARPSAETLLTGFRDTPPAWRAPAELSALFAWEYRHGYQLPHALKAWLSLSDGLFSPAPLVHPLSAIGPMVPFALVPGLIVQPESWFELGNPNRETVCIDLGYRLPGGDFPIFTSGDDEQGTAPRIIASSFEEWLLHLLKAGGSEYWFKPGSGSLGDPWEEHRRHVDAPELADHLHPFTPRVLIWMRDSVPERVIAERLEISTFDVEAIARYIQHTRPRKAIQPATRKAL